MQQSSKTFDPVDKQPYPDPLSVNYNKTQLTIIPQYMEITQGFIENFWLVMYHHYGFQELDDVLLMLNNVPYVGLLEPGDKLFLISSEDLMNFSSQKQPGA